MKKNIKKITIFITLILTALIMCMPLSSCSDDTTYTATTDFFYSSDKGHTYGNRTKEYSVGETVYMQVVVKVTTNKEEAETVNVKLTIPCISAVNARYYDGQIITPTYNPVGNVTSYEFTIVASAAATEWSFFFQFIPNAEAEVKMQLTYDNKVDSIYDRQNTIKFVS